MKKYITLLLSLCLCFAVTACSSDDVYDDDTYNGSEYTLESVAGWWTKPDDYDGITVLYTFCVDAESETVISYDDYGNINDEYPCWYDEAGFSIDCGDFFGIVTYVLNGDTLLDEEGNIKYVRSEQLGPDSAPFSTEELTGIWYKNGEKDEANECLILEENGYHTQQFDIVTGNGSWSLAKIESYYDDFNYTGPAVDFEGENGFTPSKMWALDGGDILYDDFHEEFYIKDGLDDDTWVKLCQKYELVRDGWECEEDGSSVNFTFFGEVILNNGSSAESIGQWKMTNGILYLEYADGSIQECEAAGEIFIDYCGKSFIRSEAW